MGDELNDNSNSTGEVRRKRPIPIFSDRFIERPYMRKEELSLIRDNLETLVDIKTSVPEPKKNNDNKINDNKINDNISNDNKVITSDLNVQTITNSSPYGINNNTKTETLKSEVINDNKNINDSKIIETKVPGTKVPEIKVPEIKIGIGNLVDKKNISKQTENKSKNRKVIKMADDEQIYNISPEMRKQIRKSEMEEYHNEKEIQESIKKAAFLAEQNRKELEDMKKSLAAENAEIRKDLKNEFGSKFGELSGKFNDISGKFNDISGKFENVNGKFEGVSKKLEETCTGIDCLKKDLANINKNMDLVECPECGKKIVPPLSSYCPNCNAKMYNWTEDDGITPIKGWKPSWAEK